MKDDNVLEAIAYYIQMDEEHKLTVDRLLEMVVYIIYDLRFGEHPKTEEEEESFCQGMDPDDYWAAEDYELNRLFP